MESVPFSACNAKEKRKGRVAIGATVVGLGGILLLVLPPLGGILMLTGVICFFIINPGDYKGPCPVCGKMLMARKDQRVITCEECNEKIKVDIDKQEFSRLLSS